MSEPIPDAAAAHELAALIKELRAELRSLADRVAALEQPLAAAAGLRAPVAEPVAAPPVHPEAGDDLLLIAAAVAAFLGVRARIRQVRLIQSNTWAQVGRATVHASHRVH